MKAPVFVHIIDKENLGDSACCPKMWLPEFAGCPEYDFRDPAVKNIPIDVPFIIGGGGMLHPEVDVWTAEECSRRPCCVWGIGSNYHHTTDYAPVEVLEGLGRAKLLGLRDYSGQWLIPGAEWVPCPTCKTVAPYYQDVVLRPVPLVVLSHYCKQIPECFMEAVCFDNHRSSWPDGHAHLLKTLARAQWVVTNTFHGAYWATLLGCRVINFAGNSTRFFRPLPAIVRVTSWNEAELVMKRYGNEPPVEYAKEVWLERCLLRNTGFRDRVRCWLAH